MQSVSNIHHFWTKYYLCCVVVLLSFGFPKKKLCMQHLLPKPLNLFHQSLLRSVFLSLSCLGWQPPQQEKKGKENHRVTGCEKELIHPRFCVFWGSIRGSITSLNLCLGTQPRITLQFYPFFHLG